jgi:hypothetical protein
MDGDLAASEKFLDLRLNHPQAFVVNFVTPAPNFIAQSVPLLLSTNPGTSLRQENCHF